MVKCILTSDTHYGHSQKTHRRHEKFLQEIKEKIEEENIDMLIHAGDWASYRQDQFRRTLKMFREKLGDDITIATVRGNHDFWDGKKGGRKHQRKYMLPEMEHMHREWFEEYNIIHLSDSPHIIKDVAFVGFDGWYCKQRPNTWDEEYIPKFVEGCPTMTYLSNKAHKDLDKLLQLDLSSYRKKVCVTHFPPFSHDDRQEYAANFRFLNPMKEAFDALCFGHSHRYQNRNEDDTWIYNSGSDYDIPRYVIFEV